MSDSIGTSSARGDSNIEGDSVETQGANVDVEVSNIQLRKRKKCSSLVWMKFEKFVDEDGNEWAKCNACKVKLTTGSKSGTSHLWKHLESCIEKKRLKAKTLDGIENFKFSQALSRADLARMIIMHEYPFSIVQHYGFRVFLKNLQPSFKVVSRTTITSDCMRMFEDEKQKVYGVLSKLQSKISITTDNWTSGQNSSYMSLTTHYVDETWKLRKYILNFFKVGESHTGENLARLLIDHLSEWNVGRKLFSIVLDNHTVNDVVVRELLNKHLNRRFLPLGGDLFHVRCCAHILNLIVQDGMDSIRDVIEKIRGLVKWVKSSPKRLDIFQKCVMQIDGPTGSLILDCPTRWNSTYLMLESAIKFKDVFPFLSMTHKSNKGIISPTTEEWEYVSIVNDHLKVFYDMTEVFSGSSYPTSNLYFAMMCELFISLKEWCDSEHSFISSMAHKMLVKFEKYWAIANMILSVASIFDPRQKLKPVELYFPLIYEEYEAEKKIEDVKQLLKNLFEEYFMSYNIHNNEQSEVRTSCLPTPRSSVQSGASPPARGLWLSKMRRLGRYIEESSTRQPKRSELETYLNEPVVPFTRDNVDVEGDDFDILGWWKDNGIVYPILSLIARDILAVPISIVASESAFSTGGRVVCQSRSSLKHTTVEGLICTQDWLRNELKGQESDVGDIFSTIFSLEVEEDEVIEGHENIEDNAMRLS